MKHLMKPLVAFAFTGALITVLASRGEGPPVVLRSAAGQPSAERKAPAREAVVDERVELSTAAVTTHQELRQLLVATRSAGVKDRDQLRGALASDDPLVASNALRALGRLGEVTASSAAARLIDDERPRVRQEAVVALGLGGDARSIASLTRVLKEGDVTVRPLALQALGRIGGEDARDILRAVASDPSASAVDQTFARHAIERSAQ